MGAYNPYGEHLFSSTLLTEKALDWMEDYVATVRSIVGWEMPIGIGPLRPHAHRDLHQIRAETR